MTTCILLATIICANAEASRLTPAQAAAVLAPGQFVYVEKRLPQVVVIPSSASPRDFPTPRPERRLDGSLYSEAPWSVFWQVPLDVRLVNGPHNAGRRDDRTTLHTYARDAGRSR